MANNFGADILLQGGRAEKPRLLLPSWDFEITDSHPDIISLRGPHLNLFIERGAQLGLILEIFVDRCRSREATLDAEVAVKSSRTNPNICAVMCAIRSVLSTIWHGGERFADRHSL